MEKTLIPGDLAPKAPARPVFHWGVWVNQDDPITGVAAHYQAPEWFWDEETIDLDCIECQKHAAQEPAEDPERSPCDDCMKDAGDQLVGSWKQDAAGLYEPDKAGDFAAIIREDVIQIVHSTKTTRCALCSPCYPGQGDLGTPGDFLTFTFPE